MLSNKELKLVSINDTIYQRLALQTHFITTADDYLDIIRQYVLPVYRPGDIISISEKIISLCQGKVIDRT